VHLKEQKRTTKVGFRSTFLELLTAFLFTCSSLFTCWGSVFDEDRHLWVRGKCVCELCYCIRRGLNGRELIQDCSIEVTIGRRYGLLGQNGSGKTNFLCCMAEREVPLPDHLDMYHLHEEAAPSDKNALNSVVDYIKDEITRLEKLEVRGCVRVCVCMRDDKESPTVVDTFILPVSKKGAILDIRVRSEFPRYVAVLVKLRVNVAERGTEGWCHEKGMTARVS